MEQKLFSYKIPIDGQTLLIQGLIRGDNIKYLLKESYAEFKKITNTKQHLFKLKRNRYIEIEIIPCIYTKHKSDTELVTKETLLKIFNIVNPEYARQIEDYLNNRTPTTIPEIQYSI